ncbi:unnamed protein product [Adineta steineri]|uniref:SecA family profile domain-containing protein n=1 Tax=Adineta steineri TaxID=433720 RepID=A0A814CGR7_9BILA|nr:unnamed protein product [Adineta steineri]
MFKNLKVILSLANTDTVADFDNSTEEHVNIQRDLDTKLKKLEGQKFPQGFSKPTYVLKAVDANEHSQWETQLQQESKENTGKRIILIPYYLGNSHWVGIIIQFKGTHAIQEIEFIDPVSNSSFVHENIQQKFNDLYPRVTLPSKTLQTHNDPTQSNRLTIENLLKRVEELQLMDVQTEIIDNQKTYTSLSEKIKVNGLNHIHPYEVKNTDLQKITTSPFARSETRYITPVRVNPGDVSGYTGDGFVLCDSPGFEDTNGAEVDIANGVGITKAIKGCKSVKLVILISAMSIGDRQGGVKNLARTLIGLIPGIKDHIRAVAYIFTKFSLEEKDTIHHLLKDAEQRMDEADKSDISYMLLFKDLVRKTRRNVRIIDPLEGDPLDMIDDFDDFQVINHPDEVFKFSITDKSKATVQEQIRKDQLSIMSATERSDFLFVKYKMDLLKRLYDALDQEYIKQIYDDCVENIVRHLTEEYKGATSVISRGLINERILSNEDIRYYETCINHATLAEDLRESHLKQKVVHSSAFIQYLSQQMDDMFIELHDKEINNSLIKGSLDKMKLVLNSFPRINPEKYNSTCQALAEKIKSVTTSFKTSVLSNKFDESASSITKLHEALNVLHDHLDRAYMQEEYNRMKEYFLKHIDTSVKNLTRVFDHEKLLKDDINSLNSCVSMLEGAMKTYALHPHISKKEIEKIYENLLSKILNYFQGIVQKIDAEFKNKNAFYTLRQFLEELDSIRTISVIEIKTNQFHYSIVEKIVRYLRDAKLDAEDLLKIVFQRDGKVNYDKLTKCLLNLKNAEWIEKYRSGEYSYIIKDVEERLIEHITEMKVTVMQVPLNLDNYDKIDSVHKIVSDIKEMKPLEKFLPDINQHIVDVNSWFEKEINGVCIIIKASFNTEEWKKEEEKNLDFKKVEKALQYFDACKRNCISLHNDFLCVPSDLEGFVKYHSDFVQKEMESCFENMRNFQIEGKENTEQCQKERRENLFEKARILSKRLIEVSEIKTEYCRIFACYTNQRILEQWEQRLNDYHSELTNEIEMLSATNQNLTLNNKLLTVNALRALDVPPGKTKFTNLYFLYQNKILVTTNDAVGKVLDAIKTYDYARVARGMGSLKIAGNGGEYFFEEAKQALTRSLDDFIGEIKTQAIMIGNNLEPEKIKSIVTNLKRIREAKQFISQYLDKPDELEKCIEDVKSTLETRLKRVLDGVNTLINVNSFYEAEQKIESIFFVRDLLDQYCTPALFAELEKASERQKGVVLNEIVPKYEKMDISRYMLNPPTDIFEKFGAAKNANSVYSQALEKIKETILTKFREELDLARNEEPPNPNSSHIRRFESAVKYLPEAMKNDLEVALTHCKADIDLKIDDNAKNLRNVISNEDPKAIKVVLQPNRNSQTIDPLRKEGRELILKQVQDKVNKIDQYFQQDNVNEALAYVKIVFDYHNELGSIITDIRQPYLTVRSQTKNKFEAGDFIAINKLKKRCIEFFGARRKSNNSGNSSNVVHVEPDADESDGIYTKLIENYLKINIDFQKLISETKLIAGDIKQTPDNIQWDAYVRDRIPKLIAHIFALWTLQNASSYFDVEDVVDRKNYLLQPHAAQVVSIFRMLGVGDENEKLKNNLVQIGTGEGKSITLGVTASVLALLGFDVRCACYSPYLSQRDYNGFLPVFDALGVTQYIRYGTFNKLCEDMINQNGDIRQIVEQVISTNSFNTAQSTHRTERAKILLIDEVDVFFSQDFYGNLYTPSASLREPTITSLINYIWAQRESKLNLSKVTTTPEYKACCNKFPDWEPLILEAVKDLIYDVNSFESHDYICNNDMIGYKEQDNIVYNVAYGYKTLFAYYCEHVKQQITQKSLEERISMRIKCGSFSYAEIPLQFKYIMGVTGTLETLSDPEKRIIKNVYKIEKNTIAPSVFGANNLIFRMRDDIRIENNDDYFNAIKREIDDRLVGRSVEKRAILVFFESKQKLEKFFNSRALETMNGSLQILTEEASSEEKETKIKRATRSGQVTLFTRTFGRGTDFICYDQNVSANGGAHVIQTFLSEECSEEKQIKGRTARQGDNGSYSMILFDRDLEKFHIQRENIDDVVQGKGISVLKSDKTVSTTVYETLYQLLDDKRTALFKTQYEANMAFVQQAKEKHEVTRQFLLSLNYGDLNFAKTFLVKENKGAFIIAQQSRTICLMDATGSMTHLLHKCKTTVGMMFDRITMILKENNISEDSFQIQFVVYRNYNSEKDKILQSSPWETKPDNLRAFMNAINVEGGWGNEAVEIGLWHANTENERENITQVILIGDAPPNTKTEVDQKRDNYGDAYWKNTKFAEATYYEDELKKLISKQIPVHAFYVAKQAEASFKKIAKETGGRCHLLDINSQAGANMLTDLVTEVILKNVGGEAKGNTLVDAYRKKFGKSYN